MAAATGCDIQATSPRDTLTGVAARSVPVTRIHPLPLPTPPNSISPALPPHGLKAQLQKSSTPTTTTSTKLEPIDSDLDLQDVDERMRLRGGRRPSAFSSTSDDSGVATLAAAAAFAAGSPPYESADAITPTMLAKYHLPEILLNHGPLAIRYIIGHLTATVPGFSFIPPAKSRRLVVAALEGRGSGAEGGVGGLQGDVEFQKVSWGVWDAHRIGGKQQLQRQQQQQQQQQAAQKMRSSVSAASASGAGAGAGAGIPITSGGGRAVVGSRGGMKAGLADIRRLRQPVQHDDDDEDMYMMETEADSMSMDFEARRPTIASIVMDEDIMDLDLDDDDPEDLTDDEDWGSIGAKALREASYPNSANQLCGPGYFRGRYPSISVSGGMRVPSRALSYSLPVQNRQLQPQKQQQQQQQQPQQPQQPQPQQQTQQQTQTQPSKSMMGFTPFHGAPDAQEREAVEALLRLGSV